MNRVFTTTMAALVQAVMLTALLAGSAQAQFDGRRVKPEPPAVASRFPDPDVQYPTPSLRPGRDDFASHAEVLAYLAELVRSAPDRTRLEIVGMSQRGLAIPALVLAGKGAPDPQRPTVLVIAQQHGNEPASGEAALALTQQLTGPQAALLDRVNVIIMPRANADGAERFVRTTAQGIDVNRDHLLLRTPEARAIAAVTLKYQPQVVLDLHEFTVAGRWVDKLGVIQKYDALVQAAGVGNLDPGIANAAQRGYLERIQGAWTSQGLNSFVYFTASTSATDKVVSMGGVQPDTGRNVNGLRPAISLLIETRGVGIGRAHLLRRVHTAVVGAMTVLATAADQGTALLQLVSRAGADTRARACQGDIVIAATHSKGRQQLVFVDAVTGTDKPVEVDWRAATPLNVQRQRTRPCGYLVAPSETEALQRLQQLGVRLQRVVKPARWDVERYVVVSQGGGQRQDARGAISDGQDGGIRTFELRTRRIHDVVGPDHWFVSLDQPLAGLIVAALEPDSQNSYAANQLLDLQADELRRVMARPSAHWLTAPVP